MSRFKTIVESTIRPMAVVAYSVVVPILFYYWKYRFYTKSNTEINVFVFNVVCGFVFMLGWYGCMAFATQTFRLSKTFPLKSQYLLSFFVLGCFNYYEINAFAQWQVKPNVMEGITILVNIIGGCVIYIVLLVIISLLMLKCRFPASISLKPQKKTPVAVGLHILLYVFSLCVLFASFQEIYRGTFYDASFCWFFLYTIISIVAGVNAHSCRKQSVNS